MGKHPHLEGLNELFAIGTDELGKKKGVHCCGRTGRTSCKKNCLYEKGDRK